MIVLKYQFLTTSLIDLSLKGWENALFELGSERVKKENRKQRLPTSGSLLYCAALSLFFLLSFQGTFMSEFTAQCAKKVKEFFLLPPFTRPCTLVSKQRSYPTPART